MGTTYSLMMEARMKDTNPTAKHNHMTYKNV